MFNNGIISESCFEHVECFTLFHFCSTFHRFTPLTGPFLCFTFVLTFFFWNMQTPFELMLVNSDLKQLLRKKIKELYLQHLSL